MLQETPQNIVHHHQALTDPHPPPYKKRTQDHNQDLGTPQMIKYTVYTVFGVPPSFISRMTTATDY